MKYFLRCVTIRLELLTYQAKKFRPVKEKLMVISIHTHVTLCNKIFCTKFQVRIIKVVFPNF